jgi:hypothetical protein
MPLRIENTHTQVVLAMYTLSTRYSNSGKGLTLSRVGNCDRVSHPPRFEWAPAPEGKEDGRQDDAVLGAAAASCSRAAWLQNYLQGSTLSNGVERTRAAPAPEA